MRIHIYTHPGTLPRSWKSSQQPSNIFAISKQGLVIIKKNNMKT
jgi:hypothetical protein